MISREDAIERHRRIEAEVSRMADALEDECDKLGYGNDERRIFFDLMWDYAEAASASKSRYEVRGWRTVDDEGNVVRI